MSADILGTSWDQCVSMVQKFFTSTEARGSLGWTAQDGHLHSHTAPELWTQTIGQAFLLYNRPWCFDLNACRSVARKMTNRSAKFEILPAFPPLRMSTWRGCYQNAQYWKQTCYRSIKYTVCRWVCVHLSARNFTGEAVKGLKEIMIMVMHTFKGFVSRASKKTPKLIKKFFKARWIF